MSQMSGPHDTAINDYLRRISGFEGLSPQDAQLKHHVLGVVLSRELEAFEGDAFVVEDETGKVLGIAEAGAKDGLALVALHADQELVTVRIFGQLTRPVLENVTGLEDGDLVSPYTLTIEHPLLPSGSLVHEARNKQALDRAHEAFAKAFGHLSDTAE